MSDYNQSTCPLCGRELVISPRNVSPPWANCSNQDCDLFIFSAPLREWQTTPLVAMLVKIIKGYPQDE